MAKGRVRYITLSVVALELVGMQSESGKARFVDILLDCFRKLEAGEALEDDPQTEDNPYMNFALREAIPELKHGYELYKQKQSGGKPKPEVDQRSTSGQPVVGLIEENGSEGNGLKGNGSDFCIRQPGGLDDVRKNAITSRLSVLGTAPPDEGFWNTCNKYGVERVEEALTYAEAYYITSLKRITGMIANGINP